MAKHTPNPESEKPLPEGLRAEDMQASGDLEFDPSTLTGDVRDVLLTHIRSIKVPWSMLSEEEQIDKIMAITECGKDVVRRVCHTIIKGGFPSVDVLIGPIKIDKDIEVKIHASPIALNVELLAAHVKQNAVLILAESADYFGERAPAKPDKDQPDLPFEKPSDPAAP